MTHFFSVSIVRFEQVNACWVRCVQLNSACVKWWVLEKINIPCNIESWNSDKDWKNLYHFQVLTCNTTNRLLWPNMNFYSCLLFFEKFFYVQSFKQFFCSAIISEEHFYLKYNAIIFVLETFWSNRHLLHCKVKATEPIW